MRETVIILLVFNNGRTQVRDVLLHALTVIVNKKIRESMPFHNYPFIISLNRLDYQLFPTFETQIAIHSVSIMIYDWRRA